jgi:ADP-heptose:LPS heptosyltransferase
MLNVSAMSARGSSTAPAFLVMAFGAKGVGDHVSCSSFIRNLSQNRPDAAIDFGAFSRVGVELFKHNPYIRTTHLLDMDYLKLGGKHGLRDKIAHLSAFRRQRYEKVYVLGTKFRHAVFARLTGAKERIGYENYRRGFLLTKTAAEPLEKNIAERFLDLLVLDGMQVRDPFIELFVSEQETGTVDRVFAESGITSRDKVLCLAPFAADMRRTWGLDRFWDVALHFAQNSRFKVVVLGSSADAEAMQASRPPEHPNVMNLLGKLTILETAAAIRRSDIFLGNDSGLGHIAGAVRAKALILGYFITRAWYPLSPTVRTIIKETGCTACDLNTCRKMTNGVPECFSTISVREVIATLEDLLASKTK